MRYLQVPVFFPIGKYYLQLCRKLCDCLACFVRMRYEVLAVVVSCLGSTARGRLIDHTRRRNDSIRSNIRHTPKPFNG